MYNIKKNIDAVFKHINANKMRIARNIGVKWRLLTRSLAYAIVDMVMVV